VLVVHMESIPIKIFKPRRNRVQIVLAADILPVSVCPVQSVVVVARLENIPTKKEWSKKMCAKIVKEASIKMHPATKPVWIAKSANT
jgi:hypothetical protein